MVDIQIYCILIVCKLVLEISRKTPFRGPLPSCAIAVIRQKFTSPDTIAWAHISTNIKN